MEFKLELSEEELQKDLESRLRIRVDEMVVATVQSWQVKNIIEAHFNTILDSKLDAIISDAINNNKKTLEERVNATLDSLIKSKVKKAMKG